MEEYEDLFDLQDFNIPEMEMFKQDQGEICVKGQHLLNDYFHDSNPYADESFKVEDHQQGMDFNPVEMNYVPPPQHVANHPLRQIPIQNVFVNGVPEYLNDNLNHPSPNGSITSTERTSISGRSNFSGSDEEGKKQKTAKKKRKRRRKRKSEEILADEKRMEELKAIKHRTKEEKEELRKLRNRFSAAKSREKKRRELEEKDDQIKILEDDKQQLEFENQRLRKRLRKYEQYYFEKNGHLPPGNFFDDETELKEPKRKRRKRKNVAAYALLFFGLVFFSSITSFGNPLFKWRREIVVEVEDDINTMRRLQFEINSGKSTNITPIQPNGRMKEIEQDEILRKQPLGPYFGESTETFDPEDMECEEVVIQKKMVNNHFVELEEKTIQKMKKSKNVSNHSTISITDDEDNYQIEEDVNEKNSKNLDELPEKKDLGQAVMTYDGDDQYGLAYIYTDDISDVDIRLFAPQVYVVMSNDKMERIDRHNLNGDELVGLSYPVRVLNTSTGEIVYDMETIKFYSQDAEYIREIFSLKKISD